MSRMNREYAFWMFISLEIWVLAAIIGNLDNRVTLISGVLMLLLNGYAIYRNRPE